MKTDAFINALNAHIPADEEEADHRRALLHFVFSNAHCWWLRETAGGHVTGSAWILNLARSHALLLHHTKLNLWVQPGGHLDHRDASPAAGAMREAREETGLLNLQFASETLFDVDIHCIPARGASSGKSDVEKAHLHYDVRYLIIAPDERVNITEESQDAKWRLLEELAQPSQQRSIARMAEKSLRLRT